MSEKNNDSTIARIAGNLMSGDVVLDPLQRQTAVERAVAQARAIWAEVVRTRSEQTEAPRP